MRVNTYPDSILAQRAKRVRRNEFGPVLKKFVDEMFETMYSQGGIGLAAPQVGKSKQIIVIDIGWVAGNPSPLVLINPELVSSYGNVVNTEGCLSFPGVTMKVSRSKTVLIRAADPDGKKVKVSAKGLLAICIQHEIDHLRGATLVDKVPLHKRQDFINKLVPKKME